MSRGGHELPPDTLNRFFTAQSLWDDMKDEYKKENPDVQLMGDKFIKSSKKKLVIPKYLTDENIILPLPKPTNEEEAWNEIE